MGAAAVSLVLDAGLRSEARDEFDVRVFRIELRQATRIIVEHMPREEQVEALVQLTQEIANQDVRFRLFSGIAWGQKDPSKQEHSWELAIKAAGQLAHQNTQSTALSEAAMGFASLHSYRRARELANACISPRDRLMAYTSILEKSLKQ